MKIYSIRYGILLVLIIACSDQKKELKEYSIKNNDSLNVSLSISKFETFGNLIDRIDKISCNDSISFVCINDKHTNRHIPYLIL
ncbi:hypothetical protein H0I23_07315 [Cellulophaga sp. HaHaR_3_176]|uniref:hypothetical protein n=1 Tax=Cellulophaga sp. HaHaR_3_176 TaxID=1942464 RepID=UPI001C1F427D|nr:hypothetical protein [Cellulophaga sp. HaHaR_3_176]QWX85440.1 hypothetical protein H0I23_07315 [Cellulophaga sp. HaHaR_3_176]